MNAILNIFIGVKIPYCPLSFNNFLPPNPPTHFFIYGGGEGCGKSHLLQACCLSINTLETAVYLPLKTLKAWDSELIEGIEHQTLIAIDDIECIAGDHRWEEALFHLLNTVKLQGRAKIIISSRQPPSQSSIHLADLRSRLHWGLSNQVLPLNDHEKIQTLQHYAQKRGFTLTNAVAEFLVHRFDRNMHNLIALLKKLDQASLAAQRKITLPFVRQILE